MWLSMMDLGQNGADGRICQSPPTRVKRYTKSNDIECRYSILREIDLCWVMMSLG
jgi:hypothetical protein